MYSTCLFCTRPLGANHTVELLPVGRRLAFDAAQGRLWVICPACGRWNLVPFDQRLEVIDECERLFRDARRRYSTDHIGLARLPDGLELVRIGPALRPEFAAWRYGDRFASRRRRNMLILATAGAAGIGGVIGVHALIGSVAGLQFVFQGGVRAFERARIATRFASADGGPPLTLTRADVTAAELVAVDRPGTTWGLRVPARFGIRGKWTRGGRRPSDVVLMDHDAVVGLAHVLPVMAGLAGSRSQVRDAAALVDERPRLDSFLGYARKQGDPHHRSAALKSINAEARLAIEMLANEESERRYLEGELKLLEHQWKAADELARIADGLAVSDEVHHQIDGTSR